MVGIQLMTAVAQQAVVRGDQMDLMPTASTKGPLKRFYLTVPEELLKILEGPDVRWESVSPGRK